MASRVLFVSKPIVPPWHDGSKNLVRDIASSLRDHTATVMTTPPTRTAGGPDVELDGVASWPVYVSSGRFSPSLEANARVFAALLRARDYQTWHFVFAPNVVSSTAARVAMVAARVRGVSRVVQTIASRPKRFEGVRGLIFGHVVVALSQWTRGRLLASGVDGRRLVVIPPCARPMRVPSAEERAALRAELDLGSGPIVVYPGDLEISSGARTMALAVERIAVAVPEARIVFACRKKTSGAQAAEESLRGLLASRSLLDHVRFVGERADLAPLMHEASVVALPADDLYGKVDVPLVVIEALAAGVPVVLARGGPLETVRSALFVEPEDDVALGAEIVSLLGNDALRRECAQEGKALYHDVFRPEVVAARYEEIYDGGASRLSIVEPRRERAPEPTPEPTPEPVHPSDAEPEPTPEPVHPSDAEPEPTPERDDPAREEREATQRRVARIPRARASESSLAEPALAQVEGGPSAFSAPEPVLEVEVRSARQVGSEVFPMSTDNGVSPELFRTADEVRSSFLSFFRERGHEVVPSAPLIPANDPTLMFTAAGMVQFKDVFTGKETRPYKRAASSQKCIRISGKHNDLENVGVTARHHTFFEMLGNFSFGDYFKEEAIVSAWDLLTKEWKLPADRLVISVFGGEAGMPPDDEARAIWKKVSGYSDDRIVGMGLKDNFWQMGDTGPCGPCSEIHFFLGDSPDVALLGEEPDDKGRGWMEIWNLVFMQFERSADGSGGYKLDDLPAPCVDTGSGLERVASVVQGKLTNYDSDLLRALVDKASDISGKRYRGTLADDDVSMRVIADHARTTAFLIAEGVFPDRAGREYVLRRVMRRAIRHGHRLGIRAPFLHEVALEVVRLMGGQYPELQARKDLIASVVEQEEVRFRSTIDRGLKILDDEIATLKLASAGPTNRISGETAFKLYDTFGFPLDLTEVIAKERDLEVDNAGYEEKLAEQRARSEGSKVGEAAVDDVWRRALALVPGGPVKFVGYEREQVGATLVALVKAGGVVDSASSGDEVHVVTDVTPFYGESGGQVGDRGTITTASGARLVVLDVQKPVHGLFVHHARVAEGTVATGEAVTLEVDHELRNATRRNHSATHLLHYALRKVLGEQSTQKGSMVGPDRLRFDFSHGKPLTSEEITRIEDLVNDKILTDAPVQTEVLPIAEAKAKGAVAIFEEKYGDVVRVLTMTTDSVELCGGTHARALGEIGLFKILSDAGVAAGVRRIEGTTGKNALAYVRKLEGTLKSAAQELRTAPDALPERIGKLVEHGRELEREIAELRRKIAFGGGGGGDGTSSNSGGGGIEAMLGRARDIPGGKVLALRVDAPDASTLREIAEKLRDKLGDAVVLVGAVQGPKAALVLTVSKSLLDRYKAGELIKRVAEVVGGSGGGRPDMAQAGGTQTDKLDDALTQFWTLFT